jgi:hypothetical protein
MVTVLEVSTTEVQRFLCGFLWAKGLNAKDIHKDNFPVYDGKCLSRKADNNWVEKFSQGYSKFADDVRSDVEVAETSVSMLVEDMSRNTCFFCSIEYHMFYFSYPFVIC